MFKKLSIYSLAMLAIPLMAWLMGWHWNEASLSSLDNGLYWVTETASTPYALVTCVLLMLWLMALTKKRYSWLLVGVICATSILGTQVIKSGLKTVFAEPRPYVIEMMGDKADAFYELDRTARAELVAEHYKNSEFPLIAKHREHETGYSFPSGHTIFAVSWLLLFAGFLLGGQGQAVIFSQLFVICWAGIVLISRLRLGMHFPIDLFVSTLLAWLLHLGLFTWLVPLLANKPLFKKRDK